MTERKRTKCEIWTRVMGYHRPVTAWNKGKQSEYSERVCFLAPKEIPAKYAK